MSPKETVRAVAIHLSLALLVSLGLGLSSPVASAVSTAGHQNEYGATYGFGNLGVVDTGRIALEAEENLMLLAANSSSSRTRVRAKCSVPLKTKIDSTRRQGRIRSRAMDQVRRSGGKDPVRLEQAKRRRSDDLKGDDHGKRRRRSDDPRGDDHGGRRGGSDDPPGDDNGGDRRKDDRRKEQEIRVDDQGFIGHRFDFLRPEKRRSDKRKSDNSDEPVSSIGGSDEQDPAGNRDR